MINILGDYDVIMINILGDYDVIYYHIASNKPIQPAAVLQLQKFIVSHTAVACVMCLHGSV